MQLARDLWPPLVSSGKQLVSRGDGTGHKYLEWLDHMADGQQAHEKTFSITNSMGNMSQDHNERHYLIQIRMSIIKKARDNKCW